jgi:hypothetical protein
MQKEGPRATLLHPHEIHVITQVLPSLQVLVIVTCPKSFKTQSHTSLPSHFQFYEDSSSARQQEIEACLFLNIRNPFIRHIHLITEKPYDFGRFGGGDKVVQHVSGKWLSYEYAFMYANKFLEDKLVLLINSDIYMDRSLQELQHADLDHRGEQLFRALENNCILTALSSMQFSASRATTFVRTVRCNSTRTWQLSAKMFGPSSPPSQRSMRNF